MRTLALVGLMGIADSAIAVSVEEAYRLIPHQRTIFQSASARMPAADRAYLVAFFNAIDHEKLDVRQIALLALQIHTGQTKGFDPGASRADRERKVELWQRWLEQYKLGL